MNRRVGKRHLATTALMCPLIPMKAKSSLTCLRKGKEVHPSLQLKIYSWKLQLEVKEPEKSSMYITHNPEEENLTFYINHSLHMFVIFNRHAKVVPRAAQLKELVLLWIMSHA